MKGDWVSRLCHIQRWKGGSIWEWHFVFRICLLSPLSFLNRDIVENSGPGIITQSWLQVLVISLALLSLWTSVSWFVKGEKYLFPLSYCDLLFLGLGNITAGDEQRLARNVRIVQKSGGIWEHQLDGSELSVIFFKKLSLNFTAWVRLPPYSTLIWVPTVHSATLCYGTH
jgi:hypothetical protein